MIWNYVYTPAILPSLLTVLLTLALALYSVRRRSVPGVLPFMIGSLFAAVWAAGSTMEYAATDLATKIFWIKFQTPFQLLSATTMTCFALEYAWPGRWLTRRNLALLSIAPLVLLGLIFYDSSLHWIWRSFRIDGAVIPLLGPGGWIAIGYSFALVILNISIFTWLFVRSPQHRWPVGMMIAGHLGVRALYLLEKGNIIQSHLPLDVLGLAFVDLMYAIALYGFRLFDPIPLARKAALEQLHDGMLVLDLEGRVVSLNTAAERMLNAKARQVHGTHIQNLLPALQSLSPSLINEVALRTGKEVRFYDLNLSALRDFRGLDVGHLLLLRDVTERERAQAQIIEQQRALATLHERSMLARELHDDLSQELSYINVQAQTIEDLLAAGNVEQAGAQLRLLAKIAREIQVDVRGQITRLSLDKFPVDGFVSGLQRFTEEFMRMYDIPAEFILSGDPTCLHLEPTVELQLMRITQEAFTNIRKHACAKHISVNLVVNLQRVTLSIHDDGAGFVPNENNPGKRTFGLNIMAERAAEIGASLEVQSIPGQGTRVVVEVPEKR